MIALANMQSDNVLEIYGIVKAFCELQGRRKVLANEIRYCDYLRSKIYGDKGYLSVFVRYSIQQWIEATEKRTKSYLLGREYWRLHKSKKQKERRVSVFADYYLNKAINTRAEVQCGYYGAFDNLDDDKYLDFGFYAAALRSGKKDSQESLVS